tara:strand:- start:417 stop:1037 length:621 start_codon:yes stop_codon:yes gene_type:complete
MSSDLKVTNIKHVSSGSNNLVLASDGSATIGQISSSSVFPTGHIIACKQWIDTSGNTTVNSNSLTALNESSVSQNSFSATSGNSYLLSFTGSISVDTDGSNVRARTGNLQLRYGTSAIADEATSLGSNTVEFTDNQIGRLLIAASSSTSAIYAAVSLDFIFTATSTATYYFNLVGSAGNVRNMVMLKNSNNPLITRYFEIQGDVTA